MQMSYLVIVAISLVLGMGTQWYINSTFKRWSQVPVATGETGARIARRFLNSEGLSNVPIQGNGKGDLSDYYDPRTNALYLSNTSERGSSVASMAVACHEAGHAVQHARNYLPVRIRTAILPVVNIGSQLWMIVLVAGIMVNVMGLIDLGIILFAFTVVFQIVTLPVEFDASNRALAYISNDVAIPVEQQKGARQMLVAAALTYVAAALTSILQLAYLLGQRRD